MTGLFVLFVKPCLERVVLSFVCLFFPSPPGNTNILAHLSAFSVPEVGGISLLTVDKSCLPPHG